MKITIKNSVGKTKDVEYEKNTTLKKIYEDNESFLVDKKKRVEMITFIYNGEVFLEGEMNKTLNDIEIDEFEYLIINVAYNGGNTLFSKRIINFKLL